MLTLPAHVARAGALVTRAGVASLVLTLHELVLQLTPCDISSDSYILVFDESFELSSLVLLIQSYYLSISQHEDYYL